MMNRLRTTLTALLTCAAGALLSVIVSAQLPGPPVGAPQSVQSLNHAYNFEYLFSPSAADGSGFRVAPTVNGTSTTGQTLDGLRVSATLTIPNSSSTATLLAGLRVATATCTANSGTITQCANFVVDAAPTGGSTNSAMLVKGAIAQFIGGSTTQANGALSLTDFTTSNSNTTQSVFGSTNLVTLGASALNVNGRGFACDAWGRTANNANSKDVKITLAGTTAFTMTGITLDDGPFTVRMTCLRTGSSTQNCGSSAMFGSTGKGSVNTTFSGAMTTQLAVTDTSAIVVAMAAQNTSAAANAIIGQGLACVVLQ